MLSSFPIFPPEAPYSIPPPPAFIRVCLHQLTQSYLLAFTVPKTWASSLHRTKNLFSH